MKCIGRGLFSTVYQKNKNKVLIVSTDPVKECMANGWFPRSSLFPKVVPVGSQDEKSMYEMKYYQKVTAPKQQLNPAGYDLYCALRNGAHQQCGKQGYSQVTFQIEALPKKHTTAKRALLAAVEALTNYGEDISFEISPRNIVATKTGKLILLDCFFMRTAAERQRKRLRT